MMSKQYGPDVECTFTERDEATHRPGNSGPFFCMACGATDHEEAQQPDMGDGRQMGGVPQII